VNAATGPMFRCQVISKSSPWLLLWAVLLDFLMVSLIDILLANLTIDTNKMAAKKKQATAIDIQALWLKEVSIQHFQKVLKM
jgi:hypothetical protein